MNTAINSIDLRHDEDWHNTNGPILWENGNRWEWWLFDGYHRYYGPQDSDGKWFLHNKRIK
jgi:hypothetical protein